MSCPHGLHKVWQLSRSNIPKIKYPVRTRFALFPLCSRWPLYQAWLLDVELNARRERNIATSGHYGYRAHSYRSSSIPRAPRSGGTAASTRRGYQHDPEGYKSRNPTPSTLILAQAEEQSSYQEDQSHFDSGAHLPGVISPRPRGRTH